jgi:hypothetical protein
MAVTTTTERYLFEERTDDRLDPPFRVVLDLEKMPEYCKAFDIRNVLGKLGYQVVEDEAVRNDRLFKVIQNGWTYEVKGKEIRIFIHRHQHPYGISICASDRRKNDAEKIAEAIRIGFIEEVERCLHNHQSYPGHVSQSNVESMKNTIQELQQQTAIKR